MKISRRKVVVLGASAVSASLLPINLLAQSDGQSAEDIIKEFTEYDIMINKSFRDLLCLEGLLIGVMGI